MDVPKERVGSYEIVRVLARGGMAIVYLARQPALGRDVALKRLDLERRDPTLAQRFVREAQMAAALDHPNVVTLFDFCEYDGVPFIAMEYVSGGSLRPLMGSLRIAQVFGVLEGILAALEHAESHGIAHRDLKPENVLVTGSGAVKIADFGIARAYNQITARLTGTGTAIGTPAYMAPEQARNGPLGPYTDIYAVGVMAFELLAGRPPFDPSDSPMAVLYQHVHQPVPALSELAPGAPAALIRWVEWLLAKAPADRPQSGAVASRTLEEIAVAELGPYWRRDARIATPAFEPEPANEPHDADADPPAATLPAAAERTTAPRVEQPQARRFPRLLVALIGTGAFALAAGALMLSRTGDESARGHAAESLPYDFDGDGRQELVVGLPRWSVLGASGGGVAVMEAGAQRFVTASSAGVPGEPQLQDQFGSGLTSADFDGNGRADLAVGAPGTNLGDPASIEGVVAVLLADRAGIGGGRRELLDGSRLSGPYRVARYGVSLAAADLNRDGFDDLVIGAPGADEREPTGSGAIEIAFGGRRGLREGRRRTLRRPDATDAFGSRVRIGDVDADGHLDVVEGGPDPAPSAGGHGSWCAGSRSGPATCRTRGSTGQAISLAVADVNGDRYADVIEGDPGQATTAGRVRIYDGGPDGPAARPQMVRRPDGDRAGDAFGSSVAVGRLDGDRFADLVVGSPALDATDSRVDVIRGGRRGPLAVRSRSYGPRAAGLESGHVTVGRGVSLLDLTGDRALDVAVGVTGVGRGGVAVLVLEGGGERLAPARMHRLDRVSRPPGTTSRDAAVRLGRAPFG